MRRCSIQMGVGCMNRHSTMDHPNLFVLDPTCLDHPVCLFRACPEGQMDLVWSDGPLLVGWPRCWPPLRFLWWTRDASRGRRTLFRPVFAAGTGGTGTVTRGAVRPGVLVAFVSRFLEQKRPGARSKRMKKPRFSHYPKPKLFAEHQVIDGLWGPW